MELNNTITHIEKIESQLFNLAGMIQVLNEASNDKTNTPFDFIESFMNDKAEELRTIVTTLKGLNHD